MPSSPLGRRTYPPPPQKKEREKKEMWFPEKETLLISAFAKYLSNELNSYHFCQLFNLRFLKENYLCRYCQLEKTIVTVHIWCTKWI
jgi:hypothetical protein